MHETRPPVIGIIGALGSGKTTVAKSLIEDYGYTRLSMAKPLKDMLRELGLSEEDVSGPQDHRAKPNALLCGKSPRYALQTLGTEWGRRLIGGDVWVNAVQAAIVKHKTWVSTTRAKAKPAHAGVVIDDIRFPNEALMVQRLGGVLIRINRLEVERPMSPFDRPFHALPEGVPKSILGTLSRLLRCPVTHESEYHYRRMRPDVEVDNTADLFNLLGQVDDFMTDYANRSAA